MNRLKEFFLSESTPRWQILLGGFALVFVGFLQNEIFYQRSVADAEIAAEQQRVQAKLVEIQQHSIDFQTFANAYVTSVLDSEPSQSERRDLLIANILAQDAAIDVARNVFSASLDTEISAYRAALREMKFATEQVTDVASMGQFWIAASNLLVARNNLLDALDQYSREFRA